MRDKAHHLSDGWKRSKNVVAQAVNSGVSTWSIDASHTTVEFAVKHMMVATTKGRFTGVSGTIQIDDQDLSRSKVEVEIDASTISTGDPNRDGHLKSGDFLEVETHPKLTFVSSRVTPKGGDDYEVEGDLTIRGVTKPVTLKVEKLGGGKTPFGTEIQAYEAKTKINRKDFGLTWNVAIETGGLLVGDEVKISIDTEVIKQQ